MASYGGVPMIDFSPLGDLPKVYKDARTQAVRERTLANLAPGPDGTVDYATAARALLQAGDTEGGLSLARLADASAQRALVNQRDTRDFGFRQQEAQRAQRNADRSFGLQERAATSKPTYQTVEDPATGQKRLVQIAPLGQGARVMPITGMEDSAPGNPFATGKFTKEQTSDALYANRMMNAERILRDPSVVEAATSLSQRGMNKIPVVGNYLVSTGFQKFDQAKRDFINALLRRESGAAISQSEFDNAEQQYFPQPGDTKEKLLQKQQNRVEAIKGIGAGAGPAFRPQSTFGPNGEFVPNPGAAPQSTPQRTALPAGVTPQSALDQAKKAIAAGKDRNAIIQRLQSWGIDGSGL